MDSDIKIFGENETRNGEDLDTLAAQTEELRQEGTLDRAKRLGRELAALAIHSPELPEVAGSFGVALAPAREQHQRVLMVFSAQQALREQLAPQLLSEAAITAMNNFLINRAREFWDTISDGSAFTQYLLALRAPEAEQSHLVGEAFARVCGQEDNPDLLQLGATVFGTAKKLVTAKWSPE